MEAGGPLESTERSRVWAVLLQEQLQRLGSAQAPRPPAALSLLLLGEAAHEVQEDDGEEVLFDPAGEQRIATGAAVDDPKLVAAFAERFFAWCAAEQDSGEAGDSGLGLRLFHVLAQLLRYHCPDTACTIEASAAAAGATPRGDLPAALQRLCGGPAGLVALLLAVPPTSAVGAEVFRIGTPPRSRASAAPPSPTQTPTDPKAALLLFCDLVVAVGTAALPLCAAALLLAEAPSEPDGGFEDLVARLRGPEALGGLGAHGVDGARRCVAGACALLEATPVSTLSALLRPSAGVTEAAARGPALCVVSAAEVLHHAYERPSCPWRLVVVDVRMRCSSWGLPVCVRLRQAQHTQRRQLLLEMPYEEQIHLCLMGDSFPVPGDDAFELCRYLLGPRARRRHVSVVEGGWPAVEALARSLGLDLLPLGPELAAGEVRGADSTVARTAAVERAAEVVGQVVSATETATAMGQKVAQQAWARAGRAWQLLSSFVEDGADEAKHAEGTGTADENIEDLL